MLGLAEINEYNMGRDTVKIKHNPIGSTYQERDKNKIDRFETPILYKVIGRTLYLLPNNSYQDIMGESFEFSYNGKSFHLNTPSNSEFDLIDFLNFVERKTKLIERV